ncbi:winged helix-turn-helix domain-containing protein [Ancylobacter oerskovii]|uniref:Helix-turn-helix domain-containing protein n=1 Tax=Ancylobacter oerskovii TaxID=459519 RepID=A0ABW4YWN8_9HYPH|nr:helix-turn-helix domain-containing protein [Ancylobacter oerskovii]MBS7542227.1 winged helix-turn-helix domain-containing protein [Ancylobacter oerskovii]
MTGRSFDGVTFDEGFLFATRGPGDEIRFTRSERAVLRALTSNARRVMSRGQLLDAIAGIDANSTDRSVDFIINRLRAKLGDRARAPRFIATQYGEGYVWIARPSRM